MDGIDNKLDMILTRLFPKLSTAGESELYDLVDRYGGFEEFLKRDDLLTELYAKAITGAAAAASSTDGSTQVPAWQTAAAADASPRQREINIKEFKKDLTNEIGYDLNNILRSNFERFEKLLTVQNNNNTERLASLMEQQGNKLDNILTTVTSLSVLDQGKLVNRTVSLRKEKLQDPVSCVYFHSYVQICLTKRSGISKHMGSDGTVLILLRRRRTNTNLIFTSVWAEA